MCVCEYHLILLFSLIKIIACIRYISIFCMQATSTTDIYKLTYVQARPDIHLYMHTYVCVADMRVWLMCNDSCSSTQQQTTRLFEKSMEMVVAVGLLTFAFRFSGVAFFFNSENFYLIISKLYTFVCCLWRSQKCISFAFI